MNDNDNVASRAKKGRSLPKNTVVATFLLACASGCQDETVPRSTSLPGETPGLSRRSPYGYPARASGAAGSLEPFVNGVTAVSGLVAAYALNEGAGTGVTDASGNGNAGVV